MALAGNKGPQDITPPDVTCQAPAPSSGASAWSTVAPVIIREVLLPYAVYLALHSAGVSSLLALIAGASAAVVITTASAARSRRVTALAGIVLLTLILSIIVSLISGNARVTLARDCLITGGLGIIMLGSLTRQRPLLFHLLAPLSAPRFAGGEPEFERHYDESPTLRSALMLSTIVWGLVLLADAALRLTAVLVLPVTDAATAATLLTIVTVLTLVGWLRFYLPRQLRASF